MSRECSDRKERAQWFARRRWYLYGCLGKLAWIKSVCSDFDSHTEVGLAKRDFDRARVRLEEALNDAIHELNEHQRLEIDHRSS